MPLWHRLFPSRERSYLHGMDDTRPSPQEWIDALARAEADVAAGRVVDGAAIHRELAASIERMTDGRPPAPK